MSEQGASLPDRVARAEPRPGEDEIEVVASPRLDRLANEIVGIWRDKRLEASYATGALVLNEVFGGDPERLSRYGPERKSLAALADALAERGIDITAGKLRRMAHCHVILREYLGNPPKSALRRIAPSHAEEMSSLPEERRGPLLDAVEEHGLPVTTVRERVRALKSRAARPRRAPRREAPTGAPKANSAAFARLETLEEEARALIFDLATERAIERTERLQLVGLSVRFRELGEQLRGKLQRG